MSKKNAFPFFGRLASGTGAAALAAAALTAGAETVFEENFRFYSDYTPAVTFDKGLQVGCDGVWELVAQLDCNATKPLDVFAKPVKLPAGNRFNLTMTFTVNGKAAQVDAKTKEVRRPAEPSWFDLVFTDKAGRRETVRIASDRIADTSVPFLDRGWKNFGFRSDGKKVELFLAVDRGHEFVKIGETALKNEAVSFNIAATPEKSFTLKHVKVTTADEPLMSFPVEKHFADFRSLTQPIAGGTVAKGGEEVKIPLGEVAGLSFKMNATNATAELLFEGAKGGWKISVGDFRKDKRDATINLAVIGGRGGIEQWVRPNMRPFTENAETGQRGMVPAGYDILREWDRTPAASQHVTDLDFVRNASGAVDVYLDGSRVATVGADVRALVFKPGAGVAYRVKDCAAAAKVNRAKYLPIDLSVNPRAKALVGGALSGVKPGFGTFGGAPVKVVEPIDSADVSICRQGKGNWALEVEEYHGRNPQQGFPMAIHYRVPAATYAKAHVVFALDPDPKKDPILTVRLGRYVTNGVGGNMMGDTVLDFTKGVPESCRKVGEVKLADRTANVYYAEVPVNVGRIIDLACGDYLDFEFTGKGWENFQQLDNSMKPDPNSDSAFNILGVTLEKAPFNVVVREAAPGNVFTVDEKVKKTAFDVIATVSGARGALAWTAKDFDGNEVFRGEKAWSAAKAGETNAVEIAFEKAEPGYYALDVDFLDAAGRKLFTHAASYGILPEAGRQVSRRDSPYAMWWFNCHGSTGNPAVGGPLLKKAGIRKFSWNSMKQEDYDRYDATSCGNFMIAPRHSCFDNASGKFKAGTYKGADGKPVKAKDGEEWVVGSIREQVAKMPKDSVPHLLVWHESAPGASVPEELLDEPVPPGPVYYADKWDAAYINELARIVHKHFPGLPIQIGNSTWSIGAVVGPMRAGAKPESYDRIGIETPSQVVVPERLLDCGLQGMQITMDAAEAISGSRLKANGTWEFVYRCERDMGERQQAEWYMRDILISLMHDFYLISPGIFFDCSSGYYNGLWGGSGLMRRSPWVYPKPAYVAYGVLTKVLDGVKFVRQLDTGSTTVYAVEFKRLDGKTVTALWASRGSVDFKVTAASGLLGMGGGGEIVEMLGRKRALKGGESVVKGGTSPVYLVTEKPLKAVAIAGRGYPKADAIVKGAKVAAAFDKAEDIELKPDPWLETLGKRHFLPVLKPCDEFTLKTVEDETMGQCVELALGPERNPKPKTSKTGKNYSERYITRYTTLRLKEPKAFDGRPAVVGVWVKGDSNWGQVRFEIEDADGEVFKNQSTGRWWMCDIMDWPGNLAVNFDGWSYVYCSLLDNRLVNDRSPGLVAEQWVSEGGDKQMKFPVKLRAITVGMNRAKLDLMDFKPAANVIRLKNACGTEE